MEMDFENEEYKWSYCTVGGVTRVNISTGQDIAHLGELDRKLWTVLSCPVNGLEFDPATLAMLDSDNDGRIHVDEVIEAAKWLTSVMTDPDKLTEQKDGVPLGAINVANEKGQVLYYSAKRILANLGVRKDTISTADTANSLDIFCKTRFNGDGVITANTTDDENLRKVIATCIETIGAKADRSGEDGIDADSVEEFFTALADYSAWKADGEQKGAALYPYGADTERLIELTDALKDKVSDYFIRCRLAKFNGDTAKALDVSLDSVSAISAKNMVECTEDIAAYPLARIDAVDTLPLDAVNPAWQAQMDEIFKKAIKVDYPMCRDLSEEQWNGILAKLVPFKEWLAARKGEKVASVAPEYARELLEGTAKDDLLALIAEDKKFESEYSSIQSVDKLVHYYRDFYKFLRNFVTFADFYDRDDSVKAIFQAGRLYIDQRCCKLCVKVSDMSKHTDMSSLSGMFLVYCDCTHKVSGEKMTIVAAMTVGDVNNLREGKNALFYDNDGAIWDATVVKVIENPISIRQAFWSPYRKFARFIENTINKFASEKDSKVTSDITGKIEAAPEAVTAEGAAAKKQPFDIAKFCGIFAAIGLALGAIGTFVVALLKGFVALSWWKMIIVIVVILLLISGPAMIMAWLKLRKRNLAPVLNANGWAVNAQSIVNTRFGATLTESAKLPKIAGGDPYSGGVPTWRRVLYAVIAAAAVALLVLYLTGTFPFGERKQKAADVEDTEVVAEPQATDQAVDDAQPADENVEAQAPAAEPETVASPVEEQQVAPASDNKDKKSKSRKNRKNKKADVEEPTYE